MQDTNKSILIIGGSGVLSSAVEHIERGKTWIQKCDF